MYDLVVMNSGTIPAKNVRVAAVEGSLEAALGGDASTANKQRWLACFSEVIPVLQNGERMSCSFGTTQANDTGFWKYHATIAIRVFYEGRWWKHQDEQVIRIADSDSFTGYSWE
jgi:hypothetical protein